MAADKPGLLEELKRRHVWRVAVAYAIAGWLIVQIATQVFPFFNIPNWAVRLVVILIAIGFPVAVVFAWVYELTPEGIRRTEPADSPDARPEHASRQIGRKLNAVIVAVLVLAVALLGWRVLVLRRAPAAVVAKAVTTTGSPDGAQRLRLQGMQTRTAEPARRVSDKDVANQSGAQAIPAASAAAIPEKSVAVLPFVNESGDRNQQYFSDGLSEDLINALSQFAGLKVISRDSAFQFRNSKDSSARIGKLLDVAHLLEGSVQRAGNEVRITAALVDAANGSVLWSKRYDKPYTDLFALQDAITKAVAGALQAKLLTAPGAVVQSNRPPSGSLAAYAAYQRGIAYYALDTEAGYRHAVVAFGKAEQLDPRYAAAYAWMCRTRTSLAGQFSYAVRVQQEYAKARKASATALALDPESALAHDSRAFLLITADMNWTAAAAEYRRALQLAPNNAWAKYGLASASAALGHNRRAVQLAQQALEVDPRNASWYVPLGRYLVGLGRLREARQEVTTAIALQPGGVDFRVHLAKIDILQGNFKAALRAAQQEPPGAWHAFAMALALQVGPNRTAADRALKQLIAKYADVAAYQIAEVYALRGDPDGVFHWLNRAWANRDPGIALLLTGPMILRYRNDPRFAAFCKKVGLPTTTDAVAMK